MLEMPTAPRTSKERVLLEAIALDPELSDSGLKSDVRDYLNGVYALITWLHSPSAIIRRSFEDVKDALDAKASYNGSKPVPRIVAVQTSSDLYS